MAIPQAPGEVAAATLTIFTREPYKVQDIDRIPFTAPADAASLIPRLSFSYSGAYYGWWFMGSLVRIGDPPNNNQGLDPEELLEWRKYIGYPIRFADYTDTSDPLRPTLHSTYWLTDVQRDGSIVFFRLRTGQNRIPSQNARTLLFPGYFITSPGRADSDGVTQSAFDVVDQPSNNTIEIMSDPLAVQFELDIHTIETELIRANIEGRFSADQGRQTLTGGLKVPPVTGAQYEGLTRGRGELVFHDSTLKYRVSRIQIETRTDWIVELNNDVVVT